MKPTFAYLVLYFSLVANIALAQSDKKAEKLKIKLSGIPQANKKRFLVIDDLIWHYRNKDFKQASTYARQALTLAKKIDYHKGISIAYIRLGLIFHNQGKYDSSLYYCQKSLNIEQKINHAYGIARAQNEIGIVYLLSKKYQKAINHFTKSINVLEKGGQWNKIGSKKANLAVCYKNLGDFTNAIKLYQEAIDIYKKSENTKQLGEAFLGLGVLYQRTNNFVTAYDYLQMALANFEQNGNKLFLAKAYHELGLLYNNFKSYNKAIEAYKTSLGLLNSLKTTQNIQITYNNLGQVYLDQLKLNEAQIWFQKSLELALQKNDTLTLALLYNNIGSISYKSGKYLNAIENYEKSLALSSEISEKYNKRRTLKNMSYAYARLSNYQKAFEYFQQYNQAKDSLETSFRQAMDLKDAYQKQKQKGEILKKNQTIQQKELARLKELSRRQRLFNYFLGVSLLLLITTVLAIIKIYQGRQKVKLRQDKIDELLNEQEFVALSKMLEGQEQERNRIAQDLHDRLGGILAMVQSHFNALENNPKVISIQKVPQYQKATELLDNACDVVRKVAHNMSSSILRKFGLIPALFELKETVEQTNSLVIDIIDTGFDDQRLPANYETQVYRIVQEMVSNVLKHAQAQKLEIQLLWTEDNLHMSAEDDGKGFNVQKLEEKNGMGLQGMESRVKKLDGEFTVDSTEGKGTIIMIDLPI